MPKKPQECPCCGQPGQADCGYFISECGTQYKVEKCGDSYGLYGPLKGRTNDCYEMEIQDQATRIRFLTQEKAALLKIENELKAQIAQLQSQLAELQAQEIGRHDAALAESGTKLLNRLGVEG